MSWVERQRNTQLCNIWQALPCGGCNGDPACCGGDVAVFFPFIGRAAQLNK